MDIGIKYKKLIIYYFSGTGNAEKASHWIIEYAEVNSVETELINIANFKSTENNIYRSELLNRKDTLIGFCYPTHGFNAPPIVLKFIKHFHKGKSDLFLLNTRAGMKLFKLVTPGLGGIALWLPSLMLWFKGYKPIGFRPIDLPSNWISVHPGLTPNAVNLIHKHCKIITDKFAHKILKGEIVWNGFLWLPLDILVSPIAVLYYFYGRFVLAKTFCANKNCNLCGQCIKQCPVNAIKIIDNRLSWSFKCESCMRCMNNCPQRAIETPHLYLALLWWVSFFVIPKFIVKAIMGVEKLGYYTEKIGFSGLFNFISLLIGFIIIFLGYRLMHYLSKFKFINFLLTQTSFTHYKFWRRYKSPKEY